MSQPNVTGKKYLTTRQVCERYNISDRTVWRWQVDPKMHFPAPMTIKGRKYFNEEDLIAFERRRSV